MHDWNHEDSYTDLPLHYEDMEQMEDAWTDGFNERDGNHYWDVVEPGDTVGIKYGSDNVINAPKEIRTLYEMCQRDRWNARDKSFYYQALAMAHYEASFADNANFNSYMPTYSSMSILQMRTYFTFRTLLRRGSYPEMSTSYLLVYIYETLMLVGVDNAEEGLTILEDLYAHYIEKGFRDRLSRWIKDFVMYYGLHDMKERYFASETDTDKRALALANYEKLSDETFYTIMEPLLRYDIKGGALYKRHAKDSLVVAGRCLKGAARILERRYKCTFDQLCIGKIHKHYYTPFTEAVFYEPEEKPDSVFEISPRRKYVLRNGLWIIDYYADDRRSQVYPLLSDTVHECDRQLRLALGVSIKIKARLQDEALKEAVRLTVADFMKEKAEATRPKIEVDFSKLRRIREDAEAVKEALLTDEEKVGDAPEEPLQPQPATSAPTASDPVPPPTSAATFFTPAEEQFLLLLTEGGDWSGYLRTIHVPLGVMTEGINEKMMEELGDIVIDDDGSGPFLISDYTDDVKAKMTRDN